MLVDVCIVIRIIRVDRVDKLANLKSQLEHILDSSQQAEQTIDKALKIAPEDSANHYQKARLLWRDGKYQEAEQHFWEASLLQPNNPDIRAWFLEAKLGRNQLDFWRQNLKIGDGT